MKSKWFSAKSYTCVSLDKLGARTSAAGVMFLATSAGFPINIKLITKR